MIDKSKLSYTEWESIFTKNIEISVINAFQCSHCKKIYRNNDIGSWNVPLKLPTLEYCVPAGFGDKDIKEYFCSFECLMELLKKVPFGFEVKAPTSFHFIKSKWECIE